MEQKIAYKTAKEHGTEYYMKPQCHMTITYGNHCAMAGFSRQSHVILRETEREMMHNDTGLHTNIPVCVKMRCNERELPKKTRPILTGLGLIVGNGHAFLLTSGNSLKLD